MLLTARALTVSFYVTWYQSLLTTGWETHSNTHCNVALSLQRHVLYWFRSTTVDGKALPTFRLCCKQYSVHVNGNTTQKQDQYLKIIGLFDPEDENLMFF